MADVSDFKIGMPLELNTWWLGDLVVDIGFASFGRWFPFRL